MCTGACSKFISITLYVLAAVSILCNILLFFPDFKTEYVAADSEESPRITPEVKYMGGLVGGGLMVLVPAIHIHLTSAKHCCANRCGMFLSIGFAALGVIGGVYSLCAAGLGLANGPTCFGFSAINPIVQWTRPFSNSSGEYLSNKAMWEWCLIPKDVVEFNLALFAVLLVTGCLEVVLCLVQMINGLFGCICGTCAGKE